MTRNYRHIGVVVALATLPLAGTFGVVSATTPPSTEPTMGTETIGSEPMSDEMTGPTGPLCAAIPADGEGSAAGMADDPLGVAGSNHPLVSTALAMATAAGLGEALNAEGPFTVFTPINSAFDKVDPTTLEALQADTDALAQTVLYHVIAGRLSSADLVDGGTFATLNGAELTVTMVGETLVINGGEAAVQCADVLTANATVFLIDTVLTPPATGEAVETTEGSVETTEAAVVETTDADVAAGDAEDTVPAVETTVPAVETTVPVVETTAAA